MHTLFKKLIRDLLVPDEHIANARTRRIYIETRDKTQATKLEALGVKPRKNSIKGWLGPTWYGSIVIEEVNGQEDPNVEKIAEIGFFGLTIRNIGGKENPCFTFFPIQR